jgi:flagellar basal body rod protein FlgG
MLPGLYSAASALTAAEQNHEAIARNLAHANVSGYRRQIVAFEPFAPTDETGESESAAAGGVGTTVNGVLTDFTQGAVRSTGRRLDMALSGDGFFVVEGPNGPLYTRNGGFHLSAEGQLVTADGRTVLGGSGALTFPVDVSPSQITVGPDGTIRANGAEVGALQLASFADNQQLIQVGTTFFQAPDGVVGDQAAATVQQGARELSNVSAVDELVRMIVGMRHYEAAQKSLKALAEAVEQSTNPVAG